MLDVGLRIQKKINSFCLGLCYFQYEDCGEMGRSFKYVFKRWRFLVKDLQNSQNEKVKWILGLPAILFMDFSILKLVLNMYFLSFYIEICILGQILKTKQVFKKMFSCITN